MKIEGDGKVGIGITTSLSNLLELRSSSMNTPGLLLEKAIQIEVNYYGIE